MSKRIWKGQDDLTAPPVEKIRRKGKIKIRKAGKGHQPRNFNPLRQEKNG